jgi:hypothetical protein
LLGILDMLMSTHILVMNRVAEMIWKLWCICSFIYWKVHYLGQTFPVTQQMKRDL